MSAPADIPKVLDETLKTFQDEYKDRLETWRMIDGKAQMVLTTSGAFLGGVFALVQKLPTTFDGGHRALVLLAVTSLAAAVIASLLALRPRSVFDPPTGKTALDELAALEARGPVTVEQVLNMKRDTATVWLQCVQSMAEANRIKATLVRRGQVLIGAGALCVSVVILLMLFGR
jgi:hypothetical protein